MAKDGAEAGAQAQGTVERARMDAGANRAAREMPDEVVVKIIGRSASAVRSKWAMLVVPVWSLSLGSR